MERAEAALRALGISGDLRVRHFGDTARVELSRDEQAAFAVGAARDALDAAVRAVGYTQVELTTYRSGALNVLAGITGTP